MHEIRIHAPYVERLSGGRVRVVSDISLETDKGEERRKLWYETTDEWADMLVHERADAFLVGLIPFIARNGGRVSSEAPVSAHLVHNIRHLLSPVLPLFHPGLAMLDLETETDSARLNDGATDNVGTGCSCGIDSMATLATYANCAAPAPKSLRINHLTFFDVGAHEKIGELIAGRTKLAEDFAASLNLPLVKISSNIDDFSAGFTHIAIHTFRSMSAVLVMQKLFTAYHYASAYPITKFKVSSEDVAYADEYILRCLSTESTRLYSALAPLSRQERTALVADYAPAAEFLNVCVRSVKNCGFCFKCARTMFQLDLIGKLDGFKDVFDIDAYRRNEKKILKLLAKDGHFHDEFLDATSHAISKPPFSLQRLKTAFMVRRASEFLVKTRKRLTKNLKKRKRSTDVSPQ